MPLSCLVLLWVSVFRFSSAPVALVALIAVPVVPAFGNPTARPRKTSRRPRNGRSPPTRPRFTAGRELAPTLPEQFERHRTSQTVIATASARQSACRSSSDRLCQFPDQLGDRLPDSYNGRIVGPRRPQGQLGLTCKQSCYKRRREPSCLERPKHAWRPSNTRFLG